MKIPEEARKIIDHLGLQSLDQEGGYFLRTYTSSQTTPGSRERPLMTCIYFLITQDNFSAFHKVKSDEIYHFYGGATLELNLIHEKGEHQIIRMGNDPLRTTPQFVIPKNIWQGSRIAEGEEIPWSLIGATVSPGFDFEDFELGDRKKLIAKYPAHASIIQRLTR